MKGCEGMEVKTVKFTNNIPPMYSYDHPDALAANITDGDVPVKKQGIARSKHHNRKRDDKST